MSRTELGAKLEGLLEDHRVLRALLGEFETFLKEPRPEIGVKGFHTWAATFSEYLVKLHDKLFRHFRDEDRAELPERLAVNFPQAADRLARLTEEHGEILAELRLLVSASMGYSEGKPPADPRLRLRAKALLARLARHEEIETDLMQEIVNRDYGTGD